MLNKIVLPAKTGPVINSSIRQSMEKGDKEVNFLFLMPVLTLVLMMCVMENHDMEQISPICLLKRVE